MERRILGATGISVSEMALGAMMFGAGGNPDHDDSARVIHAALDAGINLVDTSDVYSGGESEIIVGQAIKGRRDDVVLATKFCLPMGADPNQSGGSRRWITRAVEDSLRRLGTDRIDLYQLHQPDPETPIPQTLAALDELVRAGKVREIGCSNFSAAQLREAQAAVRDGAARFVSVQNEYSLVQREPESEVLAECERQGLGFLPFFPLASGLLTGKYRRGAPMPAGTRLAGKSGFANRFLNQRNLALADALADFAARRGHSLLELAFSWLLSHRQVCSVIAGAISAEQVGANVAAAGWRLTPDELAEVDEASEIDRLAPPQA